MRPSPRRGYEIFIVLLSVYVVAALAIEIVSDWPTQVKTTLNQIDFVICMIFLGDWFYFFSRSDQKGQYFKSRWIDLVASIPYAEILRPLRIFRVVRVVRALRLIRGLKGAVPILRTVTKSRQRSAFTLYLSATAVIYFYCALGLLNFEKDMNDSINTYGDALWCSFTTLTSVGYGDIYPKTTGGRFMAGILVLTGMGLFSMVTAEFASLFLNHIRGDENSPQSGKE